MDFSVTVPEDWLHRRRTQVAEASRKIRARKKKEEEELRQENTRLREERTSLLQKITELEASLNSAGGRDEELENELLRMQLEQHKGFLKGFLETIANLEPNEKSSKGELSRQNRDFAVTHGLRMIAESQRDTTGQSWKKVVVMDKDGKPARLPGLADYSLLYSRPRLETLNIRCDIVVPGVDAKNGRDTYSKSWHETKAFQSVFGSDLMVETRELPEFAVDDAEKGECMRAFHSREPLGAKFRDTCFLAAIGEMVLSKSTLQLPPGRGPELSQEIALQEIANASSSGSGGKRVRRSLDDPVDWGIYGTAQVYYGVRTVTGHGLAHDDANSERMMSTGIEMFFVWNEEIESIDSRVAGPGFRVTYMLSLPPGFKFGPIGGIDDFVDTNGKVGVRFFRAVSNLVSLVLLNHAAERLFLVPNDPSEAAEETPKGR